MMRICLLNLRSSPYVFMERREGLFLFVCVMKNLHEYIYVVCSVEKQARYGTSG